MAVCGDPRLSDLRVRPARFRRPAKLDYSGPAWIRFTARAADTIVFRAYRATHPRGRRRVRWKRVSGKFDFPAFEGKHNEVPFSHPLARRLRPGLYRLVAHGRGEGRGAATRFRVIR